MSSLVKRHQEINMGLRFKRHTAAIYQRGSALFMALMILIVLTLLAVVTSSNSVLQERMTGNFRDSALAFEAAENSLRWAEA